MQQQLEFDLTRRERSAAMILRALRELDVSPVRIAVILQLVLDPSVYADPIDSLPTLRTTTRRAADWITRHIDSLESCSGEAVRKAWQWWVDEGVLILVPRAGYTLVKTHKDRIENWENNRRERHEQYPMFARLVTVDDLLQATDNHCQPVTTTDNHCQPVTTTANHCQPVTTADNHCQPFNQLNNRESKDSSSIESSRPVLALDQLPDPPPEAFTAASESEAISRLSGWWDDASLDQRLGDAAQSNWHALAGLVIQSRRTIARKGGDPLAYYHRSKRRVQPFVVELGRKAIDDADRAAQVRSVAGASTDCRCGHTWSVRTPGEFAACPACGRNTPKGQRLEQPCVN